MDQDEEMINITPIPSTNGNHVEIQQGPAQSFVTNGHLNGNFASFIEPGPSRGQEAVPTRRRGARALVFQRDTASGTEPDENTKSIRIENVGNVGYYPTYSIGTGADGTVVYRGYFGKAKRQAAVKALMEHNYEIYANEIKILNKLNHPHIVRYFDTAKINKLHLIAMELAVTDVEKYLHENNPSPDDIGRYIREVLDALASMHRENIVHRDIKPSNVLLFSISGRRMIAKLSDFGFSKELRLYTHSASTAKGTQLFMSPECFRAYDRKTPFVSTKESDIFSLGSTIFYFLTKQNPCGEGDRNIMNNLHEGRVNLEPLTRRPEHIPYFHLLGHMLLDDPSERVPIKAIVPDSIGGPKGHPCFWNPRKSLEFIKEASTFLSSPDGYTIKNQLDMLGEFEWKSALCDQVKGYFSTAKVNHFNKDYAGGNGFVKLVKFIRNKDVHFDELPPNLKEENVFGDSKDTYINYFLSRFPFIVILLFSQLQGVDKDSRNRNLDHFYVYNAEARINRFTLLYRFRDPTQFFARQN